MCGKHLMKLKYYHNVNVFNEISLNISQKNFFSIRIHFCFKYSEILFYWQKPTYCTCGDLSDAAFNFSLVVYVRCVRFEFSKGSFA